MPVDGIRRKLSKNRIETTSDSKLGRAGGGGGASDKDTTPWHKHLQRLKQFSYIDLCIVEFTSVSLPNLHFTHKNKVV